MQQDLAGVGHILPPADLAARLLMGLPPAYHVLVTVLESSQPLVTSLSTSTW
jgi:hypothetical protein